LEPKISEIKRQNAVLFCIFYPKDRWFCFGGIKKEILRVGAVIPKTWEVERLRSGRSVKLCFLLKEVKLFILKAYLKYIYKKRRKKKRKKINSHTYLCLKINLEAITRL